MKKLYLNILCLFWAKWVGAQTYYVSQEEVNLQQAESYGILPKIQDRVQLYVMRAGKLSLSVYDDKLHKLGERELELDKKNTPKLLEVVGGKSDFSAIFHYTKRGHKYLKINKYDVHGRLLDSATVYHFGRTEIANLEIVLAEDKQSFLVYGISEADKLVAVAAGLDSLRTLWSVQLPINDWNGQENLKQILLSNRNTMYIIYEKDNRLNHLEKHHFCIKSYGLWGERLDTIRMEEAINVSVKFAYDNKNNQLVGGGFYSKRWNGKIQGTFHINTAKNPALSIQPFENEFMMYALGKKSSEGKGLEHLQVRELILRKDGGFVMLGEQIQDITRSLATGGFSTTVPSSVYQGYGTPRARFMSDHYYDDFYAFAYHPQGALHWKTILHKKQYSHDDDGHFSSCFVMKTAAGLRLLYNDAIERSTTVSEYLLKGDGAEERHSIMNTADLDILLRFRDALQISANEVLIPSEIRGKARLVKIIY